MATSSPLSGLIPRNDRYFAAFTNSTSGIGATMMLLVFEVYMGAWATARASWWHSSVIIGSDGFCSTASAFVLSRRYHISMTVSLKAKASFTNLGSYPTLFMGIVAIGVPILHHLQNLH